MGDRFNSRRRSLWFKSVAIKLVKDVSMVTTNPAHAKAQPGEPFVITRHGRAEATVSAVGAKQPVRSLVAFRAARAGWRKSSADLLREMRDESL